MKLTTQELDEMQRVDIGATSADTLPDVSGMAFQKGLSREDRITRFMQGAKNLYCYCVGGVQMMALAPARMVARMLSSSAPPVARMG